MYKFARECIKIDFGLILLATLNINTFYFTQYIFEIDQSKSIKGCFFNLRKEGKKKLLSRK